MSIRPGSPAASIADLALTLTFGQPVAHNPAPGGLSNRGRTSTSGWSVEAPAGTDGPGEPLDLPSTGRRDGRNEVVVPIDGASGFFRLVEGAGSGND